MRMSFMDGGSENIDEACIAHRQNGELFSDHQDGGPTLHQEVVQRIRVQAGHRNGEHAQVHQLGQH